MPEKLEPDVSNGATTRFKFVSLSIKHQAQGDPPIALCVTLPQALFLVNLGVMFSLKANHHAHHLSYTSESKDEL